jgi:hypothetical protein
LQPGLSYQHASWPVDELLKLYLTETAPHRFELMPTPVWIEVRGSRGEFQLDRLGAPEFIFRKSIAGGSPIGEAAEHALEFSAAFEPGRALAVLLAAGLVTGVISE